MGAWKCVRWLHPETQLDRRNRKQSYVLTSSRTMIPEVVSFGSFLGLDSDLKSGLSSRKKETTLLNNDGFFFLRGLSPDRANAVKAPTKSRTRDAWGCLKIVSRTASMLAVSTINKCSQGTEKWADEPPSPTLAPVSLFLLSFTANWQFLRVSTKNNCNFPLRQGVAYVLCIEIECTKLTCVTAIASLSIP